MPYDASMMAGGGEMMAGAGGGPQPVIAPGEQPQGVDTQAIIQALEMGLQQSVNEQGYVDIQKLATLWPQIAQQVGLDVPFQTVMQLLSQNPEIISSIVEQLGIAGIMLPNGELLTAEQLAGVGSGATGAGAGPQMSPVEAQGRV